jgi:hypothetical protein
LAEGVLGDGADRGEAQRGELGHDVGELGKIVIRLSGRGAHRVAMSGREFKGSGVVRQNSNESTTMPGKLVQAPYLEAYAKHVITKHDTL